MRTRGTTRAIRADTHTLTAVRWSWPIALDCSLWSPPHGRHSSYRSWWRQLHVTFLCSPPSYLSICLYFSFIHPSSLHFLISSFLLSPPPRFVPYSQDVERSAVIAGFPFYSTLKPAGFTIEYSKPNPSQNAAFSQSQGTHTQISCSLWGLFLKLT